MTLNILRREKKYPNQCSYTVPYDYVQVSMSLSPSFFYTVGLYGAVYATFENINFKYIFGQPRAVMKNSLVLLKVS